MNESFLARRVGLLDLYRRVESTIALTTQLYFIGGPGILLIEFLFNQICFPIEL